MTSLECVKYILDSYEKNGEKPKIWKIGTDIISIIELFIEKLKENNINSINSLIVLKNGKEYQLLINDINVTPIKGKTHSSESALRQYLDVLSSFSLIIDDNNDWKREDGKYPFNIPIGINKLFLKDFSLTKLIINLIINGPSLSLERPRNLAYTLFVYWVYLCDKQLFLNLKDYCFELNNKDKITGKKEILINKNELENLFCKGRLHQSYGKSLELLRENYDFEKLLNNIWLIIFNNDIDQNSNYSIENFRKDGQIIDANQLKTYNIIKNEIDLIRAELRNSIIERRIKNNKYHSDIEALNDEDNISDRPVYILEACHIFEIRQIKDLEQINLDDIKNPNNGIMLPKDYHYFFDKKIIMINDKGESIFDKKHLDDLKRCNIKPFRIKKEYFNDEMKQYFIKRYN